MVCEWGMSKELGPMTFGRREEQIFLGRDISHHKDYSEHTAVEIDQEVRRIIDDSYCKARQILSDHMPLLHAIAERLLEKEVLDGAEVEAMALAFREGREMPASLPPVNTGGPPRAGADSAREKPKATGDEPAIPAIPPKPVLA
jgi:cell division protease FtsH